jgi:hypothetical protein
MSRVGPHVDEQGRGQRRRKDGEGKCERSEWTVCQFAKYDLVKLSKQRGGFVWTGVAGAKLSVPAASITATANYAIMVT